MCRVIENLQTAVYSASPFPKRKRIGRGAKAAGLRYEKCVGEELARRGLTVVRGPWIKFHDINGQGFAQPDFIIQDSETHWAILEVKLSQTKTAFEQLFSLYLPLLTFLHPGVKFVPLQVCKNLRYEDDKIVDDLTLTKQGATWHWLN